MSSANPAEERGLQHSASEVCPLVLQNLNVSFLVLKIFSKIILINVLRFLLTFSVLPIFHRTVNHRPPTPVFEIRPSFLRTLNPTQVFQFLKFCLK